MHQTTQAIEGWLHHACLGQHGNGYGPPLVRQAQLLAQAGHLRARRASQRRRPCHRHMHASQPLLLATAARTRSLTAVWTRHQPHAPAPPRPLIHTSTAARCAPPPTRARRALHLWPAPPALPVAQVRRVRVTASEPGTRAGGTGLWHARHEAPPALLLMIHRPNAA